MKLAYSPASPYVRKVNGLRHRARHRRQQIERWKVGTTDPALLRLQSTVQGADPDHRRRRLLYDSPVICEYLDSIGTAPKLFPPAGPARWKALCQEALGDGILDATQPRRREIAPAAGRRPQGLHRAAAGQGASARSTCSRRRPARSACSTTIGEITIGCALGYLDFRYANEPWRPGHPKLEAWYAKVGASWRRLPRPCR